MTEAGASALRVTIKGRVSPSQAACVGALDVRDVPRHTVIVTRSGRTSDLVRLLEALDRQGFLVDRIAPAG